ncbi:aspartate/glutamate racemase family protein [Bacillus gobiensis]|uniref:aspartate/glutamate racemase family protein n=1 Tax=Bacillus gobiensis TaxID=1441095 RepID=UPI003D23CC62
MKKRLGCLHAHYSNIEYIENALSSFDIEILHFVDPALIYRVTSDHNFLASDAQNKVIEQIKWIAQSEVDAILITCTNYIAFLEECRLSLSIPIIKIDEPFFHDICNIQQPQTILFTNPATVEGTLNRLHLFADTFKKSLDLEVIVIENTFDLIMNGQRETYNQEVSKFLKQMLKDEKKVISVAQLSMVNAAGKVEDETSRTIINPLNSLVLSIVNQLELKTNVQS